MQSIEEKERLWELQQQILADVRREAEETIQAFTERIKIRRCASQHWFASGGSGVFVPSRTDQIFCSARCRNYHGVNKFRGKL